MSATKNDVMMKKTKDGPLLVKVKAVYNTDKQDHEGNNILIREGRILETGDWLHLQETYPQAEMLDYGKCYLFPGLINIHIHLEFESTENTHEWYSSESPQTGFPCAVENIETLFYSDVTTVRDTGGSHRTLELYREGARQLTDLPRLQLAGPPITITGGHLHFIPGSETDSIDDTILAARSKEKVGCTAIKIIVSSDWMTPGSTPEQTSYTVEQIRVVAGEAHYWGLPTSAHCLTTEGFANTMYGGVQCVEHCTYFICNRGNGLLERVYKPAIMEQLQNDSCYFMIGTSSNYHVFDHCRENVVECNEREVFPLERKERRCRIFECLIQLDMLPVIGMDAERGLTYFDETWLELEILYHRCRITTPELTGTVTVNEATASGLSEETRSIHPRLSADLIAMKSDPLANITVFCNTWHVMRRGKIIQQAERKMICINAYNTLEWLSLELPPPPPKGGIHQPIKQVGNLLYISGQGATRGGVPALKGKLEEECSVERGQGVVRTCVLNALNVLYDYLDDLSQIKSLIKMPTFMASADDFNQQLIVASGASQLLKNLYGEDGIGTHSVIGVNELPGNVPVETEFIFEIQRIDFISTVFELSDPPKMISPALVYYKDIIVQNTRLVAEMADGAQRLWPHVKSHKTKKMVKLQLEMRIRRFKCATITEAEMAAAVGTGHVLLAYPPVGPNLKRFLELTKAFPNTRFWVIGDDFEQLSVLSEHAVQRHMKIDTLLDVNMEMNRTGVLLRQAEQLCEKATQLPGLSLKGVHCYNGNHSDSDLQVRLGQVREADLQVREIQIELMRRKIGCSTMIMGGTPSFLCHTLITEWFLSPGTAFIDDAGYQRSSPDLFFEPAAAISTRVISYPTPRLSALDSGYRGIAADPAGVHGVITGLNRAYVLFQSEEHWIFEMNPERENEVPAISTVLYVIPTHIRPISALYPAVLVAQSDNITGEWEVTVRNRKLTLQSTLAARISPSGL